MKAVFVSVFLLCLIAPAFAADDDLSLPIFNVEQACAHANMPNCLRSEQNGYDFLKQIWPSLPREAKIRLINAHYERFALGYTFMAEDTQRLIIQMEREYRSRPLDKFHY
jgi:hypothetical protein